MQLNNRRSRSTHVIIANVSTVYGIVPQHVKQLGQVAVRHAGKHFIFPPRAREIVYVCARGGFL